MPPFGMRPYRLKGQRLLGRPTSIAEAVVRPRAEKLPNFTACIFPKEATILVGSFPRRMTPKAKVPATRLQARQQQQTGCFTCSRSGEAPAQEITEHSSVKTLNLDSTVRNAFIFNKHIAVYFLHVEIIKGSTRMPLRFQALSSRDKKGQYLQ